MIGYRFLSAAGALPPPQGLYEMVVASNGIFLRAERPGLRVILPFSHGQMGAIPGLQPLSFTVEMTRIPAARMAEMARISAASAGEALFYLHFDGLDWSLAQPEQDAQRCSVAASDPWAAHGYLAEAHSHGEMQAFFSAMDDAEEAAGFRIFLVFGARGRQALARIGVFGWFWLVPLEVVAEAPDGLQDAYGDDGLF